MQFSQHWLHTWVNPELSAEELSHLLTMAGLEVEEFVPMAPAFSGVVVAEVKSVVKHPNADHLNITQVDAGTGELVQIVCGAPNVRAGIKVPCSLPGAVLPGNVRIKPTKMRGEVSNGMLCSAHELGLPEEVSGLLVLPDDAPVGSNIRAYLDLDDPVFTLKITPNRADCLSIKGIAREVGALTQKPVTPIAIQPVPATIEATQAAHIDTPQDCGRFLTRVIRGVNAQAVSPLWLRQRLQRSGIRSVSALVDIGNYVMLELGQPMHVFDADKLSGNLVVRRARNGETLVCLNDKTVTLSDNTLVVADGQQPLSLAGLMGGAASAVNDQTQNVVLEAAWFTPEIIAGKSRQYGFGSDSSFRFERGVDYALQHDAIERATALILEICGGEAGIITEAQGKLPSAQTVAVRLNRIEQVLGVDIPAEQVQTILTHLGLQPVANAQGFTVTAPSFRFDIEIEADLLEEIGRIYGYENIPDNYTGGRLSMTRLPETQKPRFTVYQQLAMRGYQEVVSYAFVDEAWESDFAANPQPIRLQNPIASQMSVMRSTLLGGLVQILQNNLNRKQNRVRIFEIARVFHRQNDGTFSQAEKIGGLAFGSALPEQWSEPTRHIDFYDVKGDLTALLHQTDIRYRAASHPALHPGRTAEIVLGDKVIGIMGELHPKWLHKYQLPQAPIVFELDFAAVAQQHRIHYQAVSKYQPIRRDLAFVLPETVTAQQLLDACQAMADARIRSIQVFDVYRGTGLTEGHKSMAVKVMLQDMDSTLTDSQVDSIIEKLVRGAAAVNAHLRH